MKILKLTSILLLSVLVSGCGFSMRHANSFSNSLTNLHLVTDAPYSRFSTNLKHTLKSYDIKVNQDQNKADATLEATGNSFTHSSADTSLSSQARLYTFIYRTHIVLKNSKGEIILPEKELNATRNVTLNPNEILNSSNQVTIVKRELERIVIDKIMYQLESKYVRDKLKIGN